MKSSTVCNDFLDFLISQEIHDSSIRLHVHSQPPEVTLALCAAKSNGVSPEVAPRRVTGETLAAAMESTPAARAELEAAVGPAADSLLLDRVTLGRVLAVRARHEVLVTEQSFGHLVGQEERRGWFT